MQVCWWFIIVFLKTTVKHTAPQISVAPASFPQQSFCYFPAAVCRREDAIAFEREQTRFSFTPSRPSPQRPQLHHPSQFSRLGSCTPNVPTIHHIPKAPAAVQPHRSYLGSGWKQILHPHKHWGRFRVRNSHTVHLTIYATATLQQLHACTTWKSPCRMGLESAEEAAERQHEILLFTYLSNHLKHWKQLSPGAHCADAAPHSQLSCSCSSHLMERGDYQEIWHKEWVQMLPFSQSSFRACVAIFPLFKVPFPLNRELVGTYHKSCKWAVAKALIFCYPQSVVANMQGKKFNDYSKANPQAWEAGGIRLINMHTS